jgi:hypothetical protein
MDAEKRRHPALHRLPLIRLGKWGEHIPTDDQREIGPGGQ